MVSDHPLLLLCSLCGEPAYRVKERPAKFSRMRREDSRHLDGSEIAPDAMVECPACRRPFWAKSDWVVEEFMVTK